MNPIPTGDRIEVYLKAKRSNLGAWWLDQDGTVGHDCLHQMDCGTSPAWLSKVARGYDPVHGCFRNYCMTCGADAPEEVFEFAQLTKFGTKWRGKR